MTAPLRNPVRDCPVCGGTAGGSAFPYASRYAGQSFTYQRCASCQTCFIDPLPSADCMAKMYATGDYHDVFYDGEGQSAYAETAQMLAAQLPTGARVLDYGCGAGHLLSALKAAGLAAEGTEFSDAAAINAAARSGCTVYDLSQDDWQALGPWDCIHLGDVIEHLPDPRMTLVELLALLAPGGLLSAEGPLEANRSPVSLAARLFGWFKRQRNPGAVGEFPPYHLIFTTAAAQRRLFTALGQPLREVGWRIADDGWPYRRNGALRHAIAVVAMAMSRILPGWGNRFHALYRKEG